MDPEEGKRLLDELKRVQQELREANEELLRFLEPFEATFRLPGERARLHIRSAHPPWSFTMSGERR